MKARDGVGAVLGHDDRLVGPGIELRLERAFGGGQVAGVDVPAVVAVEHDHVDEVGDDVLASGRSIITLAKPTGREGSSRRVSAASGSKYARACGV
jgi:hypothetical protein